MRYIVPGTCEEVLAYRLIIWRGNGNYSGVVLICEILFLF